MKFKRLAAAVMARTMCGSLFVGCGNAKKDDTAKQARKKSQLQSRYGAVQKIRQMRTANGFRQCVTSLIQSILTGI